MMIRFFHPGTGVDHLFLHHCGRRCADHEIPILENVALPKIEEKTVEMVAKSLKMSKIIMEMPNLVPNTDSQWVAPYYDPNALETPQNSKNKFWRNFKISGGIRVSN